MLKSFLVTVYLDTLKLRHMTGSLQPVGFGEIPPSWLAQLNPSAKIVVPLHVGCEAEKHVLVSLGRDRSRLVGRGLAALDRVVLRSPHSLGEEQVKRGRDWQGDYADTLKIQVLPRDLSPEPSAKQKLINRYKTTILIEAL